MRICRKNESQLLLSPPGLDLFLPLNCLARMRERFEVNQHVELITRRERPFVPSPLVLKNPGLQLARHADIEPARFIGHDVDEVCFPHSSHSPGISRAAIAYSSMANSNFGRSRFLAPTRALMNLLRCTQGLPCRLRNSGLD